LAWRRFLEFNRKNDSRRTLMSAQSHVLVVDDEVLAAMALESILRRRGFRVSIAGDGQQALDIWNRDPADAVVTDLKMPRMTGDELAARRSCRSSSPAASCPKPLNTGCVTISTARSKSSPSRSISPAC
jgi:PleD family two-component response regulator